MKLIAIYTGIGNTTTPIHLNMGSIGDFVLC